MRNAAKIFGQVDSLIDPIAVLTLFVLSAAITGSLILGKPVLMYMNGSKPEAIKLFFYTIGWLALAMIILIIVLFLINLK